MRLKKKKKRFVLSTLLILAGRGEENICSRVSRPHFKRGALGTNLSWQDGRRGALRSSQNVS